MTSTKYNLSHHGQLKQMEKNLEESIASRQKKMSMVYTNDFDFEIIEGELDELKETLQQLQILIISYESTFEIN